MSKHLVEAKRLTASLVRMGVFENESVEADLARDGIDGAMKAHTMGMNADDWTAAWNELGRYSCEVDAKDKGRSICPLSLVN